MLNNGKVYHSMNMLNNSVSSSSAFGGTNSTYSNHFKAIGIRNNFMSGHNNMTSSQQHLNRYQLQIQSPPRVTDDLIAMGMNWNPSGTNTTNSTMGSSLRSSAKCNGGTSSGMLMPVRKNPLGKSNNFTSKNHKGDDVCYSDPLLSAPASFHQRINEIYSLEQETIRYEKARKLKKKSKDS